MKYEEALNEINQQCAICQTSNNCVKDECIWFVCKKAINKQIPKKPIEERYFGEMGSKIGFCPNCHTGQSCDDNSIQHCYYCGQTIDWSNENE